MRRWRKVLRSCGIALGAVSFLLACQSPTHRKVSASVYYWKSRYDNDSVQQQFIRQWAIDKLFVRFFDVDWNTSTQYPYPLAKLKAPNGFPDQVQVVPVVYIRNRVFQQIATDSISSFAQNTIKGIRSIQHLVQLNACSEIQFDCDWSLSTKDRFFEYLKAVRQLVGDSLTLSATIRLHQVKFFRKTGVPPVDYGALMYYNMVDRDQLKELNSIYDAETAAKYLFRFDQYPLELNLALPVFEQCLHFRHDGTVSLLPEMNEPQLEQFDQLKNEGNSWFVAGSDFYIRSEKIYTGDSLRVDRISKKEVIRAAKQIAPYLKNDNLQVTFYLMDYLIDKNFSREDLQDILDCFR